MTEPSAIDLVERLKGAAAYLEDRVGLKMTLDRDQEELLVADLRMSADTITRLHAALERIGKRKLGGPFRGGQVVSERREMIEIAREALRSSVGGE